MRDRFLAAMLFCAIAPQRAPLLAQTSPNPGGKIRILIVEGEGVINCVRQSVAREPIIQVEDEISINASEGRTDSIVINQTNAIAAAVATGISAELTAIPGGVAAADAVAATRSGGNGGSSGGPPSTVIVPGSPSVGGPL